MIYSHRGNGTGATPNTLQAFEVALATGAQGFECDLRLSADSQVVAWHDGNLRSNGRKVSIRRSSLEELNRARLPESPLLGIGALFDFITDTKARAILEVKDTSPILVGAVLEWIRRTNTWSTVSITGFPIIVRSALKAAETNPKLRVLPIRTVPIGPSPSNRWAGSGVLVGWQDSIPLSERIFRAVLNVRRLDRLRRKYEDSGMAVVAGVINREDGLEYFRKAGIEDIVTDDVPAAVAFAATTKQT